IASADVAVSEMVAELRDRFGAPPESVHTLIEVAAVKRLAERLRVQSIALAGGKLTIRLRRDARLAVDRLSAMAPENEGAAFSPAGVLTLPVAGGGQQALELARRTLDQLVA